MDKLNFNNFSQNTLLKDITLTDIGSKILPFLKYLVTLFGLFSVFLNFYVILILASTQRYKLMIPHIYFNGNYCIGIFLLVFLATMLVFVFQFKNLILSFVANSMLFSVGHFIYSSLNTNADDFGVVMKNRFFHVYYNFTMDEKLIWVSRLEKELNTKINVNDVFLDTMHSYNECKTRILQKLEEQKNEIVMSLEESTNVLYNLGEWLNHYKTPLIFCLVTAVLVYGVWSLYKINDMSNSLTNMEENAQALKTMVNQEHYNLKMQIDLQKHVLNTLGNQKQALNTLEKQIEVMANDLTLLNNNLSNNNMDLQNISKNIINLEPKNDVLTLNNIENLAKDIKLLDEKCTITHAAHLELVNKVNHVGAATIQIARSVEEEQADILQQISDLWEKIEEISPFL